MSVALMVLTVLVGWAFLAVLVFALVFIRKPLEATRRSLQQIAMGVRAIEKQTEPLPTRGVATGEAFSAAAGDLERLAARLRHLPADRKRT